MKILLICDYCDGWSSHNRAKAIAKFLPEHQFTIRAEGERPPNTAREKAAFRRRKKAGILKLRVLEDADEFDCIHFNFTAGITDYASFILANKERCVLTLINERSYLEGYMVNLPVLKDIVAACPHVVSLSPTLAEITGATYIPNGIDETIFSSGKRIVVGYAGTTSAIKNSALVEQACRELGLEFRSANYDAKTHHHTRKHEEMPDFYRSLDVYVHASSTEGFNNTVLEALSCGVPVLMTRAGAWQEFEGVVRFIEPTVESIKEGLRPWCGRQLVMERFLWRDIIPKYGALYERINQSGAAGISPATRTLCGGAAP